MKKPDTMIVFGSNEDIEKRSQMIKDIYNPAKNKFLINDEYEKFRNVVKLMTLEGMSEDFIIGLLAEDPGDAYAMTVDFLHSAALIMGEEYVKEHLLGRTIRAEDACRQIREDYYEKQMEPLRKMYEDLDGKIQAALSGEEQARQQLEILKLQNEHADEMYKERMKSAKTDFEYRMQLAEVKAQQKEETMKRDIADLQTGLDREKNRRQELEAENLELVGKIETLIMQISREKPKDEERKEPAADTALPPQTVSTPATEKPSGQPGEEKHFPFFWRKKEGNVQAMAQSADEEKRKKLEERRNYCISVLGSSEYSEEQVELILTCMMNEKISRTVLEYICNPKLPIHNMKAMIRFLGGGNDDEKH